MKDDSDPQCFKKVSFAYIQESFNLHVKIIVFVDSLYIQVLLFLLFLLYENKLQCVVFVF